ncbi:MAG: arginine--tRNA ligase [Deltaproteobacteria bacterium]|nr:arginine--tRNA ligase [Deltaproteobacteria bacterium]
MVKAGLKGIITASVQKAVQAGSVQIPDSGKLPDIIIDRSKKDEFGDFSTNIAMLLAPLTKQPPRRIAEAVAAAASSDDAVEKCEVAGPGFINIFLKKTYWPAALADILKKGADYGKGTSGRGRKVQVEFVSANPTGPLHIGHGRGAAVGDSLANVLAAAGYEVTREFYINDRGRQIDTLGRTAFLRYHELLGRKIDLPEDSYKGDYVKDVARDFILKNGDRYVDSALDDVQKIFSDFAKKELLDRIKKDLMDFRIEFDVWYSEISLYERSLVEKAIEELRQRGFVYEEEGALWLKTTALGDDKDRVLRKAGGDMTYFASDVAYHIEKIHRGFTTVVDVWGADHHGYEGRIRAVFRAMGLDDKMLRIIFIQLVALLRDGAPVPMGKREGEFVTLRQVMDEVGADACRFFFLMRKSDAQLDFDLELAKKQAPENPVYYVQYCHARIKSIFGFAKEKGVAFLEDFDEGILKRLVEKEELDIIKHMAMFEETVEKSALHMEPHRITFYLTELAGLFHPYYSKTRVITDDAEATLARLALCKSVGTVTANGLKLLGINAPDKM